MTLIDGCKNVLVTCSQYDYEIGRCGYKTKDTWNESTYYGCYKISNGECKHGVIKLDWVQYILQGKSWERDWTGEKETEC